MPLTPGLSLYFFFFSILVILRHQTGKQALDSLTCSFSLRSWLRIVSLFASFCPLCLLLVAVRPKSIQQDCACSIINEASQYGVRIRTCFIRLYGM